jgi:predicted TIM-barrel fold metal-dependent hydrolase
MTSKKFFLPLLLFTIFTLSVVFGSGRKTYEMSDYNKVEKIDAHIHLNSTNTAWIELAKEDNFRLLSINVDYPDFNPVAQQLSIAVEHKKNYPGIFAFASTFYMAGWDDQAWTNITIAYIDSTLQLGACAIKVWKNIGMDFRDKDSNLVMIDNARLDPVFRHIKESSVPLIGHHGEPKDCWMPVNEMVINDMKLYFGAHPQYHMFLHPEMPSYEEQIAARDRMLDKNKDINYMGAHIASLEWSLDELEKFFNRYPNARTDLGARMSYMEYQAAIDWQKTYDFFVKYQDRLIYATDIVQAEGSDAAAFKQAVHDKWISDWKFLAADSLMKVADFDKEFKGLSLPREVINKIYKENAQKLFTRAWKK